MALSSEITIVLFKTDRELFKWLIKNINAINNSKWTVKSWGENIFFLLLD